MAQYRVKVREGKSYGPKYPEGKVLTVSKAEAEALVAEAPDTFEVLGEVKAASKPKADKAVKAPAKKK